VLPLPATKYQKYRICSWRGRGWTWIDPQKEIEAAVNGMDNYLTTLQDQLAERGLDLEDVLQQRAYEIQRMKELGLPVPSNINKKPGGADDTGQQN
jgi:capsid protein